jgi:hypothetical protein
MAYLTELLRRDWIQAIHLWDFTRNDEDQAWLSETQSSLLVTPNVLHYVHRIQSAAYCTLDTIDMLELRLNVSAVSDVHIRFGIGDTKYEFVVGSNHNQYSILRIEGAPDTEWQYGMEQQLRPEPLFTSIELQFNNTHWNFKVDGVAQVFEHPLSPLPAYFEFSTGFGERAEPGNWNRCVLSLSIPVASKLLIHARRIMPTGMNIIAIIISIGTASTRIPCYSRWTTTPCSLI